MPKIPQASGLDSTLAFFVRDGYEFIPQGGGDYVANHRCAGEWITIALMKATLRFLTQAITYDVPPQNLKVSLSRLPTIPKSRFILNNVKSA